MNTATPPAASAFSNQTYLKEMINIFSKATGLNVVAVDIEGNIFLSSEGYTKVGYCRYIQNYSQENCARCRRTYLKACREALRWSEPYFFTCHAGLVMWAVPIIVDKTPIGAMICGQVLLWEPDELFWEDCEQLRRNFSGEALQTLKKEAQKLKIISPNQCQSSANLLSIIVKYMGNACDAGFVEQKNLLEWRNVILNRLEEQKTATAEETFDLSVYLKRERRFLQALRMGDKTKADKLIPLLFTDIEMLSSHDPERIRQMLCQLMTLSSRAFMESGIEIHTVTALIQEYYASVKRYRHAEELFQYTYQSICRLLDSAYLLIRSQEHASLIGGARNYIKAHYREKITVADIAKHVGLSPSYLSFLFKKKMNLSVHDYLLRVRIEESIELMKNRDLSLKEIITLCGIDSQSYYNKIFKKMIGITPGKYRNRFL